MNFSVPLSLLLCLSLTACAAKPSDITETEIVKVPVPKYLFVPRNRLQTCDAIDVPRADSEWIDTPNDYLHVLQTLDSCNEQIKAFWSWYDDQIAATLRAEAQVLGNGLD